MMDTSKAGYDTGRHVRSPGQVQYGQDQRRVSTSASAKHGTGGNAAAPRASALSLGFRNRA